MKKNNSKKEFLSAMNHSKERIPFPRPTVFTDKRKAAVIKEGRRKNFPTDY